SSSQFINAGTFRKDGSTASTIGEFFVNTGTVNVTAGTLSVGQGMSSGAINLTTGSVLNIFGTANAQPFTLTGGGVAGGTVTVGANETLAVNGTASVDALSLTGGTLNTIAGNLTVGTLNQASNVAGAGDLTVNGPWNYTSGSMGGTRGTFLQRTSTPPAGATITPPTTTT